MSTVKPIVFIGSSVEMLPVGRAVQTELQYDVQVIIWNQGVFRPGKFTLEALEEQVPQSDFALLIIGTEDVVISRGKKMAAPRDNVILEAGIFIGALGRSRSFILYDRTKLTKLPTDFLGLTPLTYEQTGVLQAAVGPPCEAVRKEIRTQGRREVSQKPGTIVAYSDRAGMSTSFASGTLRFINVFAGDLSWLNEDLNTYKELRRRNVEIRFLTDTPNAPIIKKAKLLGITFRQYPNAIKAPVKASIADADEEGEARALIVRRTVPKNAASPDSPYQYWMRAYRGPEEYTVIKAMNLLFEEMFAKGKIL